jgi:antitoxin CptB
MNTAPCSASEAEHLRRVHWQCRRGMLELDEVLRRFLALGYAALNPAQRQTFLTLLDAPDVQLSDWFMGRAEPSEPDLRALVAHIIALVQVQQ